MGSSPGGRILQVPGLGQLKFSLVPGAHFSHQQVRDRSEQDRYRSPAQSKAVTAEQGHARDCDRSAHHIHKFNSSEKRLARILLLLARFGTEGKRERVIPKVSQETLAEMVGTIRSRVSFFMNRFRNLGFIKYYGELEIHSSLLNVVLHDAPDKCA